jgi:hypothetical protein
MDWIERTLGISPDGGNGLTELMIVVALLVIVVIALRLTWNRFRMDRDSR